jgi:hypothetical protein
LIQVSWKDELHSYISGIITNKGQKSIIINGMPDHVHALIGFSPAMAVSDLVRDIKNNSSNFVNKNKFSMGHFAWQSPLQPVARFIYRYLTTSINKDCHVAPLLAMTVSGFWYSLYNNFIPSGLGMVGFFWGE